MSVGTARIQGLKLEKYAQPVHKNLEDCRETTSGEESPVGGDMTTT